MTNAFLLALAAASLATASASVTSDDPVGDLIGRSLAASEAHYGAGHWKPGDRVGHQEWNDASSVDYHQHGLRPPPLGYEWRETNGQYLLAGAETRLIIDVARVR